MSVQKISLSLSLLYSTTIVESDASSKWVKLRYDFHENRQISLEFVKLVEGNNPIININ